MSRTTKVLIKAMDRPSTLTPEERAFAQPMLASDCPVCRMERDTASYEEYLFDRVAATDPTLHPTHQWASDREYREHVEATTIPASPITQEGA